MKERPILFSGPMVRAILSGQKTQTRRGVSLPDNPDRLCAIDNQTIQRAEKALAGAKNRLT